MRTAAPSKSSTANTPARISASVCRFCRSPVPRGRRRMRPSLLTGTLATPTLAVLGMVSVCLGLVGCGALTTQRSRDSQPLPAVERSSTETTVIASYLDTCLRLARGTPAEQAEILAKASNDHAAAPTPSIVLRYAMVLSTPGHAGYDPVGAQ